MGALPQMRRHKRTFLTVILSLSVSVCLLWLLSSQVEMEEFRKVFSHIHYPALCAFMGFSLLGAFLRAWRYKLLLHPHFIGWKNVLLVTFIRNLFIDLFPARLGSLSYVYLLNKRLGFSFEASVSTFALAFTFDFLTLGPFLILAIVFTGIGSSTVASPLFLLIALLFFIVVFSLLHTIVPLSSFFLTVYKALTQRFKLQRKKWIQTSANKFQLTIDEFIQIKKQKKYRKVFTLSFCVRSCKYGSLYFLLFSILHSYRFSLSSLSFFKTILGITGAELSSALPIKGIGGFGTWESAWALTFKLMNFDSQIAIISGIGVHLITNLFEYLLGILSILLLFLRRTNAPT